MYHRLFRPHDFAACAALLPPNGHIGAALASSLPAIWQRLHRNGQIQGGVTIDPGEPEADSIVAFGITVFLDEAFVRAYLASPKPYLSALVYERLASGDPIVLHPKDVAIGNASGTLTLVILHFGLRPLPPESARAAVAAAQTGFRVGHAGYRVARVIQEAYGTQQLPFLKSGGFLVKDDFNRYYAQNRQAPPPAAARPYLMGLYRDDPESRYPGTAISDLFHVAEPRFWFSPAEQRVLLRAVMDEPDDAIAEALGISRDAVKKAWTRIFERVAAVDAALIGTESDSDVTRGKEKRRPLIQYVRHHLEEVRPFARRAPPTTAS